MTTEPTPCPGSRCSPTPEAFRDRNGDKVRCSHCGRAITVYVHRLDWRTSEDVYFADHTASVDLPPPCPACNDDGHISALDGTDLGPCPECS